jgi:hypothetical protein
MEEQHEQVMFSLIRHSPYSWAKFSRRLRGQRFSFKDRPYLKKIYDDLTPEIWIMKSRQMEMTEFGINRALWFATQRAGVKAIYAFPRGPQVHDFSSTRLNPAIQETPATSKTEKKTDRITLKQFNNSFLFLRSTWTEEAGEMVDNDFLIFDEYDRMKPSCEEAFRQGLSHSRYGYVLGLSTPSIPGYGIDRKFKEGCGFKWLYKCPACNRWNELTLGCIGKSSKTGQHEFMCECGRIIDRLADHAEWVAERPALVGKLNTYHVTQLMAVFKDGRGNVSKDAEYVVRERDRLTHQHKLRSFYNYVLGITYSKGSRRLNPEVMERCTDDTGKYQNFAVYPKCFMGVDQGDVLWVDIKYRDPTTKKSVLAHVEAIGEERYPNPWKRIAELITQFNVAVCVVDGKPDRNSAKQLRNSFAAGRVWLCDYSETQKGDPKWTTDGHYVSINRTDVLDATVERIMNAEVVYPPNEDLDIYFDHHYNLVREKVRNDDTGVERYIYVKIDDDHLGHADAYEYLAEQCPQSGTPLIGTTMPSRRRLDIRRDL